MNPINIAIIDLGLGNVNSISYALSRLGAKSFIAKFPQQLEDSTHIILPGVGHFDAAMNAMNFGGWIDPLENHVLQLGKKCLGICLGMQILCRKSEEGRLNGLSWFNASVLKFGNFITLEQKVPHMGWNIVKPLIRTHSLFNQTEDDSSYRFYFVHSYFVHCEDLINVAGLSYYGHSFHSAISKGNIFGVQFHPEKSHRYGLDLLSKFIYD